MSANEAQRAIVIMGVCGCGKSTVAFLLAQQLGWRFLDADDFHPPENRAKLSAGVALTDLDRWPWLDNLAELVSADTRSVLACSALRETYRQKLQARSPLDFVLLKGSFEVISERLRTRGGHFMNPILLRSQFDTLEQPENALVVDIADSPQRIVERIMHELGLKGIGGSE